MALSGEKEQSYAVTAWKLAWKAKLNSFNNTAEITANLYYKATSTETKGLYVIPFISANGVYYPSTPGNELYFETPYQEYILVTTQTFILELDSIGKLDILFEGGSYNVNGSKSKWINSYNVTLDKASNGHKNINGTWKDGYFWRKINGVWKRCLIWRKINGTWKKGV